ncbi:unnamed protein product [Phytophthora fragariaefolia]|uniref:Unnamed protein product n=1 Tax=Phytophthora fragariaefolia TaxID=1490495 RepID=A0A9W6XX86_9STRA|nr:unnamed protein product [Phytophthora fragariaefolia]
MNASPSDYTAAEIEENNPWFPFRQPKDATTVCQFVIDWMSRRIRRDGLSNASAKFSGLLILQMILQSKAVIDCKPTLSSFDDKKIVFESFRRVFETWDTQRWSSGERVDSDAYRRKLLASVMNPTAFKAAKEVDFVGELWKAGNKVSSHNNDQKLLHRSVHDVGALCQSVAGLRYAHDTSILNTYVLEENNQWHEFATVNFREILGYLSVPPSAAVFFSLDGVQTTILRVVAQFQESADFTMAVNSPEHECPPKLAHLVERLHLLRCCLSTQYASSLISAEFSPLIDFITHTLTIHVNGDCMRSCNAEDTCCVAFLLVLSLVSSVPALLECSDLFAELKLLNLDTKRSQPRDRLYSGTDLLSSCSLLQIQLCYDFEFVGGPSEKVPRCEVYAFDSHSRQSDSAGTLNINDSRINLVSDFIIALQNKILQAVQDGFETSSSAPMDFVLISQASWEIINELETEYLIPYSFGTRRPAAAFTEVFAKLMYNLITSNRSRLEASDDSKPGNMDASHTNYQGQEIAAFFPTDSERKLMNRLYKNYASGLSLDSSPTLLHCIFKKFGKMAIDCYPVTILMILYPTYGEADILRFLSHCLTTPSASFLWPRSSTMSVRNLHNIAPPAMSIAEAVEIILEREFPQVSSSCQHRGYLLLCLLCNALLWAQILQAIDQCDCSLLSLVQRWHSQSFWNYFDWENIVIYIYFSILYGAEFQVCEHKV